VDAGRLLSSGRLGPGGAIRTLKAVVVYFVSLLAVLLFLRSDAIVRFVQLLRDVWRR
jgi:hypothetical protein